MKKLYKIFNEIDVDIHEFKEEEVTAFERAQYKQNFRKQLSKKRSHKWKKGIVAACLSLGIGTASIAGLSQTSFAKEIPLLNSLFNLFPNDGIVGSYDEVAEKHELVAEDNDIKITLKEVVFDSLSLYLTYEIETEKDLGETPDFGISRPEVTNSHLHFGGHRHTIKKVDERHYIGLTVTQFHVPMTKALDDLEIIFNINEIILDDGAKKIKGNWNFSVHAKKTGNEILEVNKRVQNNDVGVKIHDIAFTPVSFIVKYQGFINNEKLNEKWDLVWGKIRIKDDLGNTYEHRGNGGMNNLLTDTFEGLHPDAKKLIITPYFELMNYDAVDEEYGFEYLEDYENAPKKIIDLDEVIIDIPTK